jgi:hypothetical protein
MQPVERQHEYRSRAGRFQISTGSGKEISLEKHTMKDEIEKVETILGCMKHTMKNEISNPETILGYPPSRETHYEKRDQQSGDATWLCAEPRNT